MNNDKLHLKLTSFIITLLLFFSINNTFSSYFKPNSETTANSTIWLKDIPIEVNYDKNKYYVLGVPDTINIKISGKQSSVQKIDIEKNIKARLELKELKVGDEQKVKVEITGINDNTITAIGDPEFLAISVKNKLTKEFDVIPKIRNERLLLGYSISKLTLDTPKVKITGAEETINSIYEVRAESEFKTKINKNIKEEVKFVAYDRDFNKIEDINIEKEKTTLSIEVNSIEKEFPITINRIDKLDEHYTLDTLEIEPKTVIVRAESKEKLNTFNEVLVDLELSTIKKEITELKNLKLYINTNEKYVIEAPTVNINIKIKHKGN